MVLCNTWPLLNRHKVMFQLFSSVSSFSSKHGRVFGGCGDRTTMVKKEMNKMTELKFGSGWNCWTQRLDSLQLNIYQQASCKNTRFYRNKHICLVAEDPRGWIMILFSGSGCSLCFCKYLQTVFSQLPPPPAFFFFFCIWRMKRWAKRAKHWRRWDWCQHLCQRNCLSVKCTTTSWERPVGLGWNLALWLKWSRLEVKKD